MNQETKEMLRELAYYSSLGFSVALAIFIGLFVGIWLDKIFHTSPWCMFVFLGMGIVAGFMNIIRAMDKTKKM